MNAPADGAIYSTNLIGSFLKLLPVRIEISRRAAKSMTSNSTFLSNHTELHVGVVCLFIPLRQFARSASCLVGDSVYLRCSGKVRLTPMLLFAFLFVLLTFSINSGCVSVSGPWVKYEERTAIQRFLGEMPIATIIQPKRSLFWVKTVGDNLPALLYSAPSYFCSFSLALNRDPSSLMCLLPLRILVACETILQMVASEWYE